MLSKHTLQMLISSRPRLHTLILFPMSLDVVCETPCSETPVNMLNTWEHTCGHFGDHYVGESPALCMCMPGCILMCSPWKTQSMILGRLLRGEVSSVPFGGGLGTAGERPPTPVPSEKGWVLLNHPLCKHLFTSKLASCAYKIICP